MAFAFNSYCVPRLIDFDRTLHVRGLQRRFSSSVLPEAYSGMAHPIHYRTFSNSLFDPCRDPALLLQSVVPVLEGAVRFFLDYMVLADDGSGQCHDTYKRNTDNLLVPHCPIVWLHAPFLHSHVGTTRLCRRSGGIIATDITSIEETRGCSFSIGVYRHLQTNNPCGSFWNRKLKHILAFALCRPFHPRYVRTAIPSTTSRSYCCLHSTVLVWTRHGYGSPRNT